MKKTYEKSQAQLAAVIKDFPWENKERYAAYLAQTYYYVRHSTRLLASSACRFEANEEAFHSRFLKHAREENAHDALALMDLEALGYNISQFHEMSETRWLYQSQYYLTTFKDPLCLMGYIFALEGIGANFGEETYARVLKAHGKDATKFLKLHAHEDIDHIEKAFQTIEGLPKERMDLIKYSFEQSVDGLAIFFRNLSVTDVKKLKSAA